MLLALAAAREQRRLRTEDTILSAAMIANLDLDYSREYGQLTFNRTTMTRRERRAYNAFVDLNRTFVIYVLLLHQIVDLNFKNS